jgi:hypothetical protein
VRNPAVQALGELGLGVVVGFIAYAVAGEQDALTGTLSVAVGLLTSLLAATLMQHFHEQNNQRELQARLDLLIDRVSDRALSAADAASALRYGGVEIPRAQVTRVWLDRLWRTSSRYWGMIYTAPGEVLDTNIFRLGLAILSAKVRVDQVDVRRIFVVDSEAELVHTMPAIREQQDNQINVRYVLRATLDAHPILKTQLAQLATLDFTVIDRSVVWQLLLDRNRRIKSGSLHFDDEMNTRFAEVYRMLWDTATPLSAAAPMTAVASAPDS